MSQFPSVVWCLLAAALLSAAVSGASVTTATAANADSGGIAAGGGAESSLEPRRTGWLCAPTDTAGVCLFKGLLKNAVPLFAGSWASADRRKDAEAAAGTGVQQTQSKGIEEYLMEQIQNLLGALSFGFELPAEVSSPWTLLKSSFLNARGKKNKNLGPMLAAGFAMMAGTMLPLAFGALFMVAGKALMTSLLAITISGMLGLKALFSKHESSGHQKAYTAAPPAPYYAETQYEHDLGGQYKAQTEAKMHNSAYYAGETGLSGGYYKSNNVEQQADGSAADAMDYYAAATGRPKSDGHNNIVVDNRNHGGGSGAPAVKN